MQYLVIGSNDQRLPLDSASASNANSRCSISTRLVLPNIVSLDGDHQNPHVISTVNRTREMVYDLYYSKYLLARLILWAARASRSLTDRRNEQQHHTARARDFRTTP